MPADKVRSNIILTGFMGTGKTTVGLVIAAELGYEFEDTDELIQARSGRSIPEIFLEMGEAAFRQMEAEIARELAEREGLVISTGGRLMLDEANAEALRRGGRVFCLVASPEEILSRIKADGTQRPLLEGPNPEERIAELLQMREESYRRFYQVDTDLRRPEDVAREIIDLFRIKTHRIAITASGYQYDFITGGGLLPDIRRLARVDGPIALFCDRQVGSRYAQSCGPVDHILAFSSRRSDKTLETVESLYEELLDLGFDRAGTIVALGGRTAGEIAGFVAATYMRGVKLVQCPTSLSAMVDTSIGGIVGLDLPEGKDLVGAIKHPDAVIADLVTLKTLDPEDYSSGLADVVKYGLLADPDLLSRVEGGEWSWKRGERQPSLGTLQDLVARAIQVKITFVQEDPFERRRYSILNLGHTFAHAIEQLGGDEIRHGEALAVGLVAHANLSARLGYCSHTIQERIESLLLKVHLPIRLPVSIPAENLLRAMSDEQEKLSSSRSFVLLRDIAQAWVTDEVPENAIQATILDISG